MARAFSESSPEDKSDPFFPLVGACELIKRVKGLLRKAAACDCHVVLSGETGTGKGLAAELIHNNGARRHGPFVIVDGTLLHDDLALSQLFGNARGAFTGASEARSGLIAAAEGGTLFLDEIGDTSARVQAALLRLLDEKRYQRLGESAWHAVDCRVICATRRNLTDLARCGEFRDDLLWRIRCIDITLPALRDRDADIVTIARTFLEAIQTKDGRRIRLTQEAESELRTHSWPGNVRELRSRIERAVTLSDDGVITPALLGLPATGIRSPRSLDDMERNAILTALRRAAGNRRQAARLLSIPESTLRSKVRRFGIDVAAIAGG